MIYTIQSRLGEIDWASLRPGDEVHVPYRAEPYRERVVVPCRGTQDAWIKVVGVKGPNGELPVIDGDGAVTDPQFALRAGYDATTLEPFGLVTVWYTAAAPDAAPAHLEIRNLRITGAKGGNSFTGADGTPKKWDGGASGVYCLLCDHLSVIGCQIDDNGQGVFVGDSHESSDVLLDGNAIFGNGNVGSYLQHNTYVQACRATYRNNRYGPVRPGSLGGALKDRSADVLIEGNVIEACARCIDLSAWQNVTALRESAPNATRSVVRNNTLLNKTGARFVYVEGRTLADGTGDDVQFENNTLVCRVDQSVSYYVNLFVSEYSTAAKFTAAGNLFDIDKATAAGKPPDFRVFDSRGSAAFGPNWSRNPPNTFVYDAANRLSLTGVENIKVGNTDPGYKDEAGGDYSLVDGAPATGFGAAAPLVPLPPPPVSPPLPPPPPPPGDNWGLLCTGTIEMGDTRVVTTVYKKA